MIGISIKKDRVNFLSAFYYKSEIVISDFGVLSLKSQKIDSEIIEKIINRKKIKNSNIVSKKCMICIDSDEVVFNQISTSEKVDVDTLILRVMIIQNIYIGVTNHVWKPVLV